MGRDSHIAPLSLLDGRATACRIRSTGETAPASDASLSLSLIGSPGEWPRRHADGRPRRLWTTRGPESGAIAAQFTALAEQQQEGLIRHLGVSTVSADQIAEAQPIAPVACVQNFYNIANRDDDELIHNLASQGIASAPDHPPSPLPGCCSRSPNMLLIPGTSSVAHLRENVAGAVLALSEADVAELNTIGA